MLDILIMERDKVGMQVDVKKYANRDCLTKLYSRSYCLQFMNKLIDDNRDFSVFYMDLDKFRVINDVYGHDVGDVVIQEVGKRLQSLETDDLLFARLGGDEFIGLYQDISENNINNLGQNIGKVLEKHIVVGESEFIVLASIGVARFPLDAESIDDLLKLSDMAMYKAKKSYSHNSYLITDELNKKLSSRKKIEKLLRKMDVENDLFLEYQPIFNLETGKLTSAEALVRWNHPEEGIIYPNDFIHVAEELDYVRYITNWVFETALQQIGAWNHKYGTNYRVSLNVADACIHNKIFFTNVKYMLKTFKVKAQWLALELTERSIAVSSEFMKKLLSSISETGIDIHIDKFGTHPIMISDLKEFKTKEIKIDAGFIQRLDQTDQADNFCTVKAMMLLAQGLEIKTIAKGVETKEQYEILKTLQCDKVQGFYLEKPMSSSAFEEKYLKNS